jgi:hypothetical protein
MPQCDYCGEGFRLFGMNRGRYRFCGGLCYERGAVLERLDQIAPAAVDAYIENTRTGQCPTCNRSARLNIYESHQVYSVLVYTRWSTEFHYCCQLCGRKRQREDLVTSLLVGWWGVPFGLIITPIQVLRNVMAMSRLSDETSPRLARSARLQLAERLEKAAQSERGRGVLR